MSDGKLPHPRMEVLAGFVDGTLTPDEIPAVAAHLRSCADCRTVVTETARFSREEGSREVGSDLRSSVSEVGSDLRSSVSVPAPAPVDLAERRKKKGPAPRWMAAAAAVLAVVGVTAPLLRTSPIARLIAVAPRDHRQVEPRLTGFPWARLQAPSRGQAIAAPADLKLTGAAGKLLEKTLARSDADSHRATGVAYLLIGRHRESIAALERAAAASNSAAAWNDLAAARYMAALRDDPTQLPRALADVDRALQIESRHAEALFNRALILERMESREPARAAWERYLEVDPSGEWSAEAREHLRR